ncbi:hypothetical protein [Parvularcula sp. IMCC14364]|uniref:hypothetical protein n=1 Tax=Parvularcula sp. IMCC14364 TaxID=3067902 RepID=UPI0027422E05|nr:hypothetical protein [Parvularcula sp. IMCC14364]
MKKHVIVGLAFLAAVFPAASLAQIESETLEHPDEIVTEEIHAQTYINYLSPPESTNYTSEIDISRMRLLSEIDLAAVLAELDRQVQGCTDLRVSMENEIGGGPGSWFVNPLWVKKYQNCVLQKRTDLRKFGNVLKLVLDSRVIEGGEQGATLRTELIDRLRARHSQSTQRIDQELKTQRQFVTYYNTGEKTY